MCSTNLGQDILDDSHQSLDEIGQGCSIAGEIEVYSYHNPKQLLLGAMVCLSRSLVGWAGLEI